MSATAQRTTTRPAYHPEALFLSGDYRLLSADEMASKSHALVETATELGGDLIGSWWHPQWLMIGENNSGWGVALDQRPGPGEGDTDWHAIHKE